jgi:hypothetical protein
VQIALTTLEEVFLNIAKQAEIENASGKNLTVPVELDDGRQLQAPVGVEFMTDPATNQTYRLSWGQDHNGELCVTEAVLAPAAPTAGPQQGPPPPVLPAQLQHSQV